MKFIGLILGSLVVSWSSIVYSDDPDDILLQIPSIIAASQNACDLTQIDTCKTNRVCTNSGGYWYSDKCNIDPLGLVMIRRMVGTWDFYFRYGSSNQYRSSEVYTFLGSTIKPSGTLGDYQVSGTDAYSRSFNAKYRSSDGEIYIYVPEGTYNSSGGITLNLIESSWWLYFLSSSRLTGVHRSLPIPLIPPDPAWAVKR